MGDSHAPLIYANDPRTDVPLEIQEHLTSAIAGKGGLIVSGWFGQAITLVGEEDSKAE